MSKLFVVATPLQLLIAQQVVVQEKFKDAILLESYIGNFSSMIKSYDVCRIDSLWSKVFDHIGAFPSWDNGGTELFRTAYPTWKRYKRIKRILDGNHVDSIFLADYQNQTYRFMTVLFSHQGYKVCFFEEGYSQYVTRPYTINKGFWAKTKEVALDWLYYIPLYHVRFAYWRNNPNLPCHSLPIYRRYSILPGMLNEPYDVQLYCKPLVSQKLKDYLDKETRNIKKGRKILFLSDPMSEILPQEFRCLYFEELVRAFASLDKNAAIYIKFHPRDKEEDKEHTLEIVSGAGLEYSVLSSEINIPVEYYLQVVRFEEVIFFNTSTFFYNGYLFPKSEFHSLLPELLKDCVKEKVPSNSINHIESLIGKMNKLQKI